MKNSLGGNKPRPHSMGDRPKQDNKSRSNRHEKALEKQLGARRQPNSGASLFLTLKGDLIDEHFVWQAKLTSGGRLVLSKKDLMEVSRQAYMQGKWPALALTLEGLPSNLDADWVAIPMHVWKGLTNDKGVSQE